MFKLLLRKLNKIRAKRTFHAYAYEIKTFMIEPYGAIEYAQWLHPCETPKIMSSEVIQFYESYVPKNSFIVDIGAHTGDTTVPMAIAAGCGGLTLALEPNPHVFKILEKNSQLNRDKTNIKAVCLAATQEDGWFEFDYSDASFCNGGFFSRIKNANHRHKHKLKVQGKNLNNYLTHHFGDYLDRLSFIKIDAEGYDKEILKNLAPLLKKYHPTLLTECNKHLFEEERYELFNIFKEIGGYALFKVEELDAYRKQGMPINLPETMLTWEHFDFIALKS